MIEAVDIAKSYRDGTRALDGVTVSLGVGVTALLGPNGAGKTSLIQILCGLLAPTSGSVRVAGRPIEEDLARYRNRVGYVPQQFGFPSAMTLGGMLRLLGRLRGLDPALVRRRSSELLDTLNLSARRRSALMRLSGGMRQRACIAQALLHDPPILIMDEPTVGLDPEERAALLRLLVDLGREKTVLLSTHIVEDAEAACASFVFLRGGRIVLAGRRSELAAGLDGHFEQHPATADPPDGAVPLYERVENGEVQRRYYVRGACGTAGSSPPAIADIYALTGLGLARR